MSVYHITMERGHKVARPITSEEEYRQLRDSRQQLELLKAVREEGDTKAKNRLTQFNYSGHYPDGKVRGNRLPSMAFPFDCDEKEEFERVKDVLLADPERYGLLMLERSARQGGHAVFRRERGKTILENQVRVATMLRTEMDCSTHDINRVLFATSASPDDLLYLSPALFEDIYDADTVTEEARRLEEREHYGHEELPEGAHKANKHYRPWERVAEERTITAAERKEKGATTATERTDKGAEGGEEPAYCGVPYTEIVATWWELYNDGQTPVKSNRDVLTFELAVNLRHICGFDRGLMARVIPCYDGFSEQEKMKCIDSALQERRTQLPKRLREVLQTVQQRHADNSTTVEGIDETQQQDDLFYYQRLPHLPMGVQESVEAAGPALAVPTIVAICPAIGALATGVRLDVHGRMDNLNLVSYIAGDFASGKGNIDPVIETWMSEVRATDLLYLMQEEEWRNKKKAAKNKKEQPEEPKLPVRYLTMNNTVANLAERLNNTEGKHAFSFTPEADTVSQKWRSGMSDFSIMLRQSYDGSSYEREARSVESVNVHIAHLLWNVTMCGTPDALYRVVNNYTDGFQSRIAVARTPDNTFARLEDKPYTMTEKQAEHIRQVAHLLMLMSGDLVLPKLEQRGRQWLEEVRLESMKNDDRVRARQRIRVCVTAQRMTCCIMLCQVAERLVKEYGYLGAEKRLKQFPSLLKEMMTKAQTAKLLEVYDVLADSLLENALYFFRERIENAFASRDYPNKERHRMGKNDSIYARLDATFTFEQAMQQAVYVKGSGVSRNSVHQMLKNWHRQGLVDSAANNTFRKK